MLHYMESYSINHILLYNIIIYYFLYLLIISFNNFTNRKFHQKNYYALNDWTDETKFKLGINL